MDNCKDIMLELEDVGMKTDVKRSLFMIEKNSVLVDCTMNHPFPNKWIKFGLIEVYDRLFDYMKSEGFEEVERIIPGGSFSYSNFPFYDGSYQAKISFEKAKLF